jgi:hypothetical protein
LAGDGVLGVRLPRRMMELNVRSCAAGGEGGGED